MEQDVFGKTLRFIPGAIFGAIVGLWLVPDVMSPARFFGTVAFDAALSGLLSMHFGLRFWESLWAGDSMIELNPLPCGGVAAAVMLACAYGCAAASTEMTPIDSRRPAIRASGEAQDSAGRLITRTGMGPVRLNTTLASVRQMLPEASFKRHTDGDGAAWIEVTFGPRDFLALWAGEEDPDAPIDWSRHVITISTFSDTFHTAEGVRPGSLVSDVIRVYGAIQEVIVSEIESREFIAFERQPAWLTFRLDYTGMFPPSARRTTQVQPGARILAITISAYEQ